MMHVKVNQLLFPYTYSPKRYEKSSSSILLISPTEETSIAGLETKN